MIPLNEPIEPRFDVLYIFSLDKVADFLQALASIPDEEIGDVNVWTATRKNAVLFENERYGSIYDLTSVFCLQTEFRPEHAALKAAAEAESLFYYPIFEDNKQMINWFFDIPENRPQEYTDYMISINKLPQ